MNAPVVGLVALCIAAEVARELCFKIAANRAEHARSYAAAVAASPIAWLGVALWLGETLAWVAVLQSLPLSLAFPMMALVYAAVPAAAVWLLREPMSRSQRVGAGLIALGVACVSLSGLRS